MESVPERLPVADGVKVTLMLQLVFGKRTLPQALLCAKSPLAEIEVTLSVASPVLVNVMV